MLNSKKKYYYLLLLLLLKKKTYDILLTISVTNENYYLFFSEYLTKLFQGTI